MGAVKGSWGAQACKDKGSPWEGRDKQRGRERSQGWVYIGNQTREERIWPKASQATKWLRRKKMTLRPLEEAVRESGEWQPDSSGSGMPGCEAAGVDQS